MTKKKTDKAAKRIQSRAIEHHFQTAHENSTKISAGRDWIESLVGETLKNQAL